MRIRSYAITALALVLGLTLSAGTASAQATDSVTIEVLSPPTSIAITAPETAYRGDTIQVAYSIVDDEGNPTEGIATWGVSPPDRATIIEQTDSTISVVLEQSGTVTLTVVVERVELLVIGGRFLSPGPGGQPAAGEFAWQTEAGFVIVEDTPDALALCAAGFTGEGRAILVTNDDCYENLESLTGVAMPPLGGPLIYRQASWDPRMEPCYVAPPVYLDAEFAELTVADA